MFGIQIHVSPEAVQHHTAFDVVCNPRRRRKRYSVKKRQWTTPGCYLLSGGLVVMHPALFEQLTRAAMSEGGEHANQD
ncbi:hypothetical protein OU995_11690 [Roseateles sp. SL47]|uniref:hypothetical protein n=1 Tax=Roseateles sp. SL47 TaxID=2995138 RepID=UPI002271F030|nr:hypothetical protein [Roseateles sp. SL47]WAC75310.1 hypothetical protein OU995_11690 [Roseateles sp. SL47]